MGRRADGDRTGRQAPEVAEPGGWARPSWNSAPSRSGTPQCCDPSVKLRLFAADIGQRVARVAPLMGVLASAAAEEPELDDLRRALHARRRENLRWLAGDLEASGALAPDVESAAETIWALASPELYALLSGPGGWTPDRYERWLAESLASLLLR